MRYLSVILSAATIAGCSAVPEQPMQRSAEQQATYQRLVGNLVGRPGPSCLTNWNRSNMTVIDGSTVAFSDVGTHVTVVNLSPGCGALTSPQNALLTQSSGGGLCARDIARVVDTSSPTVTVGSCSVESITTYSRP